MCEKTLDLAKDNTKEIKQDKIRPYKYRVPQTMGYNEFGRQSGTQQLSGVVLQEKRDKNG